MANDKNTRSTLASEPREATDLETMVDALPNPVVIIDISGSIAHANPQAEGLFGYAKDELLNEAVELLVPDRFRAAHPTHVEGYFATPTTRPLGERRDLLGKHRDGSDIPIEIGLSPMDFERGMLVVAAIVDLSARKRAEAEANQHSQQLLDASTADLETFAHSASHDLQAPLRSIKGFAQLLQSRYKERLDERANDWIGRIVESAGQMQILLKNLLAYSRIESRRQHLETCNLGRLVDEVIDGLATRIRKSGAHVTRGELPSLRADRVQMTQLFHSLISNSLAYSGDEPARVHIDARAGEGEWVLSVSDEGIGIAEEHHATVFEIFRRLHTQDEVPGTGIGLAIAERVARRHGGRMWLESSPGKGSTFFVSIADDLMD